MRVHRAARALVVAVPLALSLAALAGPTGISEASTPCPGWSPATISKAVYGLRGLDALSASDAWAAGAYRTVNSPPLIEHWDGTAWSVVPAPGLTNHDTGFNGVSAYSPSEAVAVGFSNTGAGYKPLADVWDGVAWRLTTLPASLKSATLVDVAMLGHGDAWAVGKTATAGVQKPVLVHWNGSAWATTAAPNTAGALLGVAATPPGGALAVGYRESPHGDTGLVMRFDGTKWIDVTPPETAGMVLTDISTDSPGEIWVVGYAAAGSSLAPVALRNDGTGWTQTPAADSASPAAAFRAVVARSPTDAWTAGMRLDTGTGQYRPLTEHWDGASWAVVDSAPVTGESELLALAGIPGSNDLWVSGHDHLIARYCGSTASPTRAVARPMGLALPRRPTRLIARPTARADREGVPVVARDVASDAGIAETTTTYGSVVADFNGDGLPDIFLGRHEAQPRMYTNLGDGQFANPVPAAISTTDRHGCAAIDVNGNGSPELLCARGARLGGNAKHNEVWMRNPDGTWTDRATSVGGVIEPFGRGRTIKILDADGDGQDDVIVVNNANRSDGLPTTSRLYLNRGGTFVAAPEFGLDGRFGSSCVATGDVNGDGFDDVLACANKGARLYLSDGTAFADATAAWGIAGKPREAVIDDVTGDGAPDLLSIAGGTLTVSVQSAGRFARGYQYSSSGALVNLATGDVNGDGTDDVYVVVGKDESAANGADVVLVNSGDGTGFTPMDVPSTSTGSAEAATAIDEDGNGLTDFVVTNGRQLNAPGAVQLIAFFPADGTLAPEG